MECTAARDRLFRKIDEELSDSENEQLEAHLALCAACAREYQLLTLPQRIAQIIPGFKPSPYFHQTLRARIEREDQISSIWQIFHGLARQMVPVLAAVTLSLILILAYFQLRAPEADLYQAYEGIYASEAYPNLMLIAEEEAITNETVIRAITERDAYGRGAIDFK